MSNHRVEITSPEMRLRIAKMLGYRQIDGAVWQTPPDDHKTIMSGDFRKVVPNFPQSKDACMAFAKHLNVAEKKQFFAELLKFCSDKRDAESSNAATAFLGAVEYCESFLRVKKQWEAPPVKEVNATVGA